MKVKIITDRRPFTPNGRAEKGDVVEVSAAEAQVLIDNGFAEKIAPKKKVEK
jgi:hypothetical protein